MMHISMDAVYVVLILLFFGASALLLRFCAVQADHGSQS